MPGGLPPALAAGHSSRPPKIPSVHLNGTSYDGLYSALMFAIGAVRGARAAVEKCEPHGRDYYLQGDSALAVATSEHLSRLSRLETVCAELQAVLEGVVAQGDVIYRGRDPETEKTSDDREPA